MEIQPKKITKRNSQSTQSLTKLKNKTIFFSKQKTIVNQPE